MWRLPSKTVADRRRLPRGRGRGRRRDGQHEAHGERAGLRAAAGHRSLRFAGCSSTPPRYAALKKAGVTFSINNALNDPQKQKSQANSACTQRREGRHRGRARQRLGRQRSRSCPRRRASRRSTTTARSRAARVDLRHLRRQGRRRPAGQGRRRRAQGERQVQGAPGRRRAVRRRTDQNAFRFKSGNDSVLNPLYKNGTFKKGPQQFVPGWEQQRRRRSSPRCWSRRATTSRACWRRTTTSPAQSSPT